MPARPLAWAARCFCRLRHLRTASSSRQNCSETNLPAVVMLSKRSIEMNPSACSRSAFIPATRSMYSGNLPAAGVNSKMTAIIGASFAQDYSSLASRGETRELGRHSFQNAVPIAAPRLPEQPRGGIPRAVFSLLQPSPVRSERKKNPYGLGQRPGEMRHCGVDADDEVEPFNQGSGVGEAFQLCAVVEHALAAGIELQHV